MYDKITLKNGIRVVGEKLPHLHSCTIGFWVGVGSSHELPSENGLSHLIEHMVFKGTITRSARQIAEEMDEIGAHLNAFTGKDCTCFYARVLKEDISTAIDILSDLVYNPKFDKDELDKERGVVLEEIAMVEDTPDDLAADLLSLAQYDGSLNKPILGSHELISKYTQDDVQNYWKTHYTPDKIVISITGNYDWDMVLNELGEKAINFNNSSSVNSDFPNKLINEKRFLKKEIEQAHIYLGFPGFEIGSLKSYTLSILSGLFGGGMSSRLFQRIREELGLAYSVYTYTSSYLNIGTFKIYAGTSPKSANRVIDEIKNETSKILKNGINNKEFLSAKTQLRTDFVFGLESASSRMNRLGRSELILNKIEDQETIMKNIATISKDDLMEVVKYVFDSSPAIAVVGPNTDEIASSLI
ncbi:MAG: insulinase family protein [Christensenellaceae bacterium]|nr:insulinase family protein [Christensenellaceae bacterium]